jgi:hypothetical protein
MSRRSLTVEDLKSVGSDWMFERGTNVEIRRRFSEETREAILSSTLKQTLTVIVSYRRIQTETRTLDRVANGSLLTEARRG